MSQGVGGKYGGDWGKILADPLSDIAEDIAAYDDTEADFEETLLEPLSISGGEAFSAEDHRGREMLELLQNARDAACREHEDDSDPSVGKRAAYIAIGDEGLLIANTGGPFDFSDSNVRKSLRILGHSEKGEETIGEFGVGLTSIRSTGESYEVWTKSPDRNPSEALDPSDCWRVLCGPRSTIGVLASYDTQARESETYTRFKDEVRGDSGLLDTEKEVDVPDDPLDPDQIPYFAYPVAMENWYESVQRSHNSSRLRSRAYDLLTYDRSDETGQMDDLAERAQRLLDDVGEFTTAVFVDYEDEDWRTLFEHITGDSPDSPDGEPADRMEAQAWFDAQENSRITPELLLNLGGIDRLVVERLHGAEDEKDQSSIQEWEVHGREAVCNGDAHPSPDADDNITDGVDDERITGVRVEVDVTTDSNHERLKEPPASMYTFWEFEFEEGRRYGDYDWFDADQREENGDTANSGDDSDDEVEVSLLVPTDKEQPMEYRPHLYYPIDGADKQFPYCIHGDFVVQQNRQSLAGTALAHNCVVAEESARLVGRTCEALADSTTASSELRASVPWLLLPQSIDDWTRSEDLVEEDPGMVGDNKPLTALRSAIYQRIRESYCIQIIDNSTGPAAVAGDDGIDVLLHETPEVTAGFASLYAIDSSVNIDTASVLESASRTSDVQMLSEPTLKTLFRWVVDDERRTRSEALFEWLFDGDDITWECLLSAIGSSGTGRSGSFSTENAKRLQQLVSLDTEDSGLSDELFVEWAEILDRWSAEIDAGSAISGVPSAVGHAVIAGTIELAGYESEDDRDLNELLGENSGPYLLPCNPVFDQDADRREGTARDSDGDAQLVTIESHSTGAHSKREVLRPEMEVADIAPPADTGFNLYLLTEEAYEKWGGKIAGVDWGTREYDGKTDFYRALLKDAANRPSEVSPADVRFLTERYEDVDTGRATELQAVEGSYHPKKEIGKLPQRGDGPDNLKVRMESRRVELPDDFLEETGETPQGRDIRFGPTLLEHWLQDGDEEDNEQSTSATDMASSELGSGVATIPDSYLWDERPERIADQLGIFGVSTLPGIRVITIVKDDAHPNRRGSLSWDPTHESWETPGNNGRRDELRELLNSPSERHPYLQLISTPEFGPGESSEHTSNCSIKDFPSEPDSSPATELFNADVMLASWVWLSPGITSELNASDLATLLEDHGDELVASILETGWSCNYGSGNIKSVDTFVPTLLNWQFRCIEGWHEVDGVAFHPPRTDELWSGQESWSLKYAVLDDVSGRSSAAELLPRIDPEESDIADEVWNCLGVKRLEDLNATEAALRLNALIGKGTDQPSKPSRLPPMDQQDGWQKLYGTLLSSIADELEARGDAMSLEKLQFLESLPVVGEDAGRRAWFSCPIDDLCDTVYYDSVESQWEDRVELLDEHRYLIPRPEGRHISADAFRTLCNRNGSARRSAKYPRIDHRTTQATGMQRRLSKNEVKHNVLAATPGQKDLEERSAQYDRTVESIRRIDVNGDIETERDVWGFTPFDSDVGLGLENVAGEDATSYAAAFDPEQVDEDAPVELAEMFQALFQGGNRASYKLALLGREVDGKDAVRRELRERGIQELVDDIRIAAAVLGGEQATEGLTFDLDEELEISSIRADIADRIRPGRAPATRQRPDLPELLAGIVETLRSSASHAHREWVADLLDPDYRMRDLASGLYPDDYDTCGRIADTQRRALKRLETAVDRSRFEEVLPGRTSPQGVKRIGELVVGLRRIESDPEADISTIDELAGQTPAWSDRVAPASPMSGGKSVDSKCIERLTDRIPEGCTWFHVAWLVEESTEELLNTAVVEGVEAAVVANIAGKKPERKKRVRDDVRKYIEGTLSTSSGGGGGGTGDRVLLDRMEQDGNPENVRYGESADARPIDLSATDRESSDGYTGPTTDRPRVAELAVLRWAYDALFAAEPAPDEVFELMMELRDGNNYWRTSSGWDLITDHSVAELPAIEDIERLEGSVPSVVFDVTDEGLCGYDILDPTAWSLGINSDSKAIDRLPNEYADPEALTPVPVEIKSVDPADPSFRFSLNQFRRAHNFVAESEENGKSVPYVLLLVNVTEHGEAEPSYDVSPCHVDVFTDPADLHRLLPAGLDSDENADVVERLLLEIVRGGKFIID